MFSEDTTNVWEVIEPVIVPDTFCTSCQISSMNKKARSKNSLMLKVPFKWVFMDTILSTSPKSLTSNTTCSNYLLIVDAYSRIRKLYVREKITTEEVMVKLDRFHSRFEKIDGFGWWDLERISADKGTVFTLTEFKE